MSTHYILGALQFLEKIWLVSGQPDDSEWTTGKSQQSAQSLWPWGWGCGWPRQASQAGDRGKSWAPERFPGAAEKEQQSYSRFSQQKPTVTLFRLFPESDVIHKPRSELDANEKHTLSVPQARPWGSRPPASAWLAKGHEQSKNWVLNGSWSYPCKPIFSCLKITALNSPTKHLQGQDFGRLSEFKHSLLT